MPQEQPTPKNDLDAIRKRSLAHLEAWGQEDPTGLYIAASESADDVPTLLGMIAAVPKAKHVEMAMSALATVAYNPMVEPAVRRKLKAAYNAFETWMKVTR